MGVRIISAYGIAQSAFAGVRRRPCCAQNALNMFVSYHLTPSLFIDFAISFAINDGESRTGIDRPTSSIFLIVIEYANGVLLSYFSLDVYNFSCDGEIEVRKPHPAYVLFEHIK